MAQVNLRDYLKHTDDMLERERYDEALAHASHILQVFPKNAHALRNLGRALVGLGRWEEAGDAFRRLLGAVPQDVTAHQALSRIYERTKQPDYAIWHAERAFDQQPSNKDILQRLSDLYATHRQKTIERFPLTAGAIATHYINNNNGEAALDPLYKALEREPKRLDLKLLLARALWTAERPIEAAEAAMEVLNELPYAVPANRLMTELWMKEGRPSDAARYLSRLEEVDPYLALYVANNKTPPADAITLDELDYVAHARRQLSNATPDWLQTLEPGTGDDAFADLDWEATIDDDFSQLPPDVARNLQSLGDASASDTVVAYMPQPAKPTPSTPQPTPETEHSHTGLTGLLGDLDADDEAWLKALDEQATPPSADTPSRAHTGLTGMLDTDASADDDDAWLRELDALTDTSTPESAPSTSSRTPTGFTGFFDDLPDAPEQGQAPHTPTGLTGMLDELDAEMPAERPPTGALGATNLVDPLAWLKADGDIEIDETADRRRKVVTEDDSVTSFESRQDPLAWLGDDDYLHEPDSPVPAADLSERSQTDPLSWMKDMGIDIDDEASAPPISGVSPALGLQSVSEMPSETQADANWLDDDNALQEMMALESLSAGEQATEVDWQDVMPDEQRLPDEQDDFEWLSDPQAADDNADDAAAVPASEDWLADLGVESEVQAQAPTQDWFADFGDDATVIEDPANQDWLGDFADDATVIEDPLEPAWVSADNLPSTELDSAEVEADPLAWMQAYDENSEDSALADDLSADWADASEEAESAAELDWMLELPETDANPEDDGLSEASQAEAEFGFGDEIVAETDADDWLSDLEFASAEGHETELEPLAETAQEDWLSDLESSVVAGAVPDFGDESDQQDPAWLDALDVPETPPLNTVSEMLESEADDFTFDELAFDEAGDEEALAEPLAEAGDFAFDELAFDEAGDAEAIGEPLAEAGDFAFDELAFDEAGDAEVIGEPLAEAGDFAFDELAFDEAGDAEAIGEPLAEAGDFAFDELAFDEAGDEEALAEPLAEAGDFTFDELAFDEAGDAEAIGEPLAEAGDFTFDELGFDEAGDAEVLGEPLAEAGDFAFDELGFDEAGDEQQVAYELPEFEAQTDDFAYTLEDEAFVEDQPDWLNNIGAEAEKLDETQALELDLPDFEPQAEQANWLSEGELIDEPSVEGFGDALPEPASAEDDYEINWLSDESEVLPDEALQTDEGVLEHDVVLNPADNAPDWLNAMVPGLDMDYAASEDAPIDAGFVQGDTNRARALSAEDFTAVNRGGIQWLNDLIDEEERAAAALPPPPPAPIVPPPPLPSLAPLPSPASSAPAAKTTGLRFSFSKAPAWLAKLTGAGAQAPASVSSKQSAEQDMDELDDLDLDDLDDFDFDDLDDLDNATAKKK